MKKAQIQNMESIAVVMIIGVLIVLGIVFAFELSTEDLENQAQEQTDIYSRTVALRAIGLDEIKCSSFEDSGNTCLDVYKLLAMEELIKPTNQEAFKYYYELFKESEIIIHIAYPDFFEEQNQIHNITIYSFEPEEIKGTKSMFSPILVFDPVANKNMFSILEVKTFS